MIFSPQEASGPFDAATIRSSCSAVAQGRGIEFKTPAGRTFEKLHAVQHHLEMLRLDAVGKTGLRGQLQIAADRRAGGQSSDGDLRDVRPGPAERIADDQQLVGAQHRLIERLGHGAAAA